MNRILVSTLFSNEIIKQVWVVSNFWYLHLGGYAKDEKSKACLHKKS